MQPERWNEIKELLAETLEQDPDERDAWLRVRCGGDEQLYADIQSLLREQENEALLEIPDPERIAQFLREHRAESGVGRRIGKFTVTGVLGYGGMGVVYRARQEHPHREVALKIIPAGLHASPYQLKLFRREVQSLARMQHGGIAALYEAGSAEDGQHYFAMELVEGSPLLDYVSAHQLELPEKLSLFTKICDAVHYAHQKGVIHRDIKPTNVLVTQDENEPQPKLLDFGLAKLMESDSATVSTAMGKVHGTLSYMSPEQARGSNSEIDVRSDVYSLGVVLFELLTQRRPFELSGRTVPQAIDIICNQRPPQAGSIIAHLRGDLETIIAKALEKEPARRYQSAHALAEDIERYLNQQPITARQPSAVYQIRKFASRHKLPVAFATLLFMVITASAVVAGMLSFRLARERDTALAAKQSETEARESAEQVVEFLVKLFEQGNPWVSEGSERSVKDLVEAGVTRVRTELHGQPLVQARLLTALGLVYSVQHNFDRAQELLESGLAIRERELGPHHMDVVDSLFSMNKYFQGKGEHDRAIVLAQRALEICRDHHPENLSRYADMLETLGESRFYAGQLGAATDYYRQCLDLRLKLYGEDNMEVADALLNLGVVLNSRKQLDEAESLLQRAAALKRKLNAPATSMIWLLDALAHIPFARGDYVETERLLKEQVEFAKTNLHKGHPWVVGSLGHYASVVRANHGPERADPIYREALVIIRENGGDAVPYLRDLAHVRRALNDYTEAETLFAEALSIRRQRYSNENKFVAESARELGMTFYDTQRLDQAEPLLLESFAIYSAALGVDNSNTIDVVKKLAKLYEDWNRPDEATIWRERLPASPSTAEGK